MSVRTLRGDTSTLLMMTTTTRTTRTEGRKRKRKESEGDKADQYSNCIHHLVNLVQGLPPAGRMRPETFFTNFVLFLSSALNRFRSLVLCIALSLSLSVSSFHRARSFENGKKHISLVIFLPFCSCLRPWRREEDRTGAVLCARLQHTVPEVEDGNSRPLRFVLSFPATLLLYILGKGRLKEEKSRRAAGRVVCLYFSFPSPSLFLCFLLAKDCGVPILASSRFSLSVYVYKREKPNRPFSCLDSAGSGEEHVESRLHHRGTTHSWTNSSTPAPHIPPKD